MSTLSVIIPTYNRLDRLRRVLAALEHQTVEPECFEVVVVVDGSTDGTDTFLAGYGGPLRLTPVFQPNSGVAAARNNGVARASGELILFIDDDVVPAPDLLAEHLAAHERCPGPTVVLGPMLTPEDFAMSPWVRWEQAMLMKQYEAMLAGEWAPTARQFYTGNSSLAREHILAAGGFDERFRRAEDVELAFRLSDQGLRFVFNPAAIGYHYAERSFRSWITTPYLYGRNDVIFAREKGQEWLLPKVRVEFHKRHPLVRAAVRTCLGRRLPSALLIGGLRLAAEAGSRLRLEPVTRAAYSGIFNLRHYQGVADELGGREHFFAQLA
ncbi:MAG TPA: exopolysaccharide biosynthesis glycosyltransferase EpsD [Roseiflexaceae bacterium]|nr:exopolysaccharide biosynthesis glycosyltransferase EpsD [Roseiflexaceae bacterium]